MSDNSEDLVNLPAILYSILWQTRELGFLKRIMESVKVSQLKILIYFVDYKPGALIILNGDIGDFTILPINEIEGVQYDGAIIGKFRPIIKALEKHLISKGIWYLITGKIKLKGKGKLLKFGKILRRCVI